MRYNFKARFVLPIQVGLGLLPATPKLEDGPLPEGYRVVSAVAPKRQTIRAHRKGKGRHARPGGELQLCTGPRMRPTLIGRARCVSVDPLRLFVQAGRFLIARDGRWRAVDRAFARADGFETVADMHAFWLAEHGAGEFEGVIVRWEPLP